MHPPLSPLTAPVIEPLALRDDRLRPLLPQRRKKAYGHQSERDVHARSLAVHALSQEGLRCEATTVSGNPEVTAGGLGQFGPRKEEPTRPQTKVLMGSLAPSGMPLATEVVAGARAEDG